MSRDETREDPLTAGLVVNPVAGMAGRVGLKGTDGVLERALEKGATPVAPSRAALMLEELAKAGGPGRIRWLTCSGEMGEDSFRKAGAGRKTYRMVHGGSGPESSADDTRGACEAFLREGADIIVFCGGDGTARDVLDAVGLKVPVLGIPSGVKMHSGVFAVDPVSAAEVLRDYAAGRLGREEVEVLDLDEEMYRMGEWNIRLYGMMLTPFEPTMVQSGKMTFQGENEDSVLEEIADGIVEDMREEEAEGKSPLYLMGPGGTMKTVAEALGIQGTLLGVDAVLGGELLARDLDEKAILALLDEHPDARIMVSPIGAQGFILGRGNLQLSPEVIRRVGPDNIMVLATPAKLARTPVLRVDTGDPELDAEFRKKGHLFVTVGYRTRRLVSIR